jgi:hypothetical protein
VTDPFSAQFKLTTLRSRAAGGWASRLRTRLPPVIRASVALVRRRAFRRTATRRAILAWRAALRLLAIRWPRRSMFVTRVTRAATPASTVTAARRMRVRSRTEGASRVAAAGTAPETQRAAEHAVVRISSRLERRTLVSRRVERLTSRRELERVLVTRTLVEPARSQLPMRPAPPKAAMTFRLPSPAVITARPPAAFEPARPGADLSVAEPPSLPRRPAAAPIDVDRLTDQVLWKIERRAVAQRERIGLG